VPHFFFHNGLECDILAAVKTLSTGGFIHMKNLVMFLGAVLVCASAACSSSSNAASAAASGNCPAVGSTVCSADPAVTQSDADACVKAKNDATCGSKYTAVLQCAGSNVKCDSSNHEDDSAIQTACKTQLDAYTSCVAGGTTTDGGT
jgi:hypothetical protein